MVFGIGNQIFFRFPIENDNGGIGVLGGGLRGRKSYKKINQKLTEIDEIGKNLILF